MIDKALALEIKAFLKDYLAFYNEFLKLEENKYESIRNNSIDELNKYVSLEQSYFLKSKGLEQKREKLIAKTNYNNLTFREILPMFDDENKEEITEIFNKLSSTLIHFKDLNESCNSLIEVRLHRAEAALKHLQNQPELQKEYNMNAVEHTRTNSIISKKI